MLTVVVDRASGNFRGPVPWGEIVPRISDFLDPKYLPDGFAFTTPDHLKIKDCVALLKHLLDREKSLGVCADVFAWKAFVQKQKGGAVIPTPALISSDQQHEDNALPPPPRPRPKGKGKQKQTAPAPLDGGSDSGMETPDDVDWRLAGTNSGHKSPSNSDDDGSESGNHNSQQRRFDWMLSGKPLIRMPEIESEDMESDDEHLAGNAKRTAGRSTRQVISSGEEEDSTPASPYPPSSSVLLQNVPPNFAKSAPPAAPPAARPAALARPADPSAARPAAGPAALPCPPYPSAARPAARPAALAHPADPPAAHPADRSAAPPAGSSEPALTNSALVADRSNTGGPEKRSLDELPAEDAVYHAPPAKRTRQEVNPDNVIPTRRQRKDSQRAKESQEAALPSAPPKRRTAAGGTKKATVPKSKPPKKKASDI